jgi:hypothetical protein
VPDRRIRGRALLRSCEAALEEDTIYGGAGKDTINALGGNDLIDGGAGADTMFGGTGNDTYVVDNSGDVVNETGGNGSDLVQSSITFSLSDVTQAIGAIENLMLTGMAKINGTGNALANEIIGNSGNNILNGLGGADILTGGQGSDKFVFTALAHSTPNASDLITDFVTGSDIFDFSTIDANTSKGGNQAFAYGGQNANVVANSVTWVESNGNTIVQADANGDTTADLQIVLLGPNPHLRATDFILQKIGQAPDMCGATKDVRFGSKADICRCKTSCPLYPRKRTCAVQLGMSAKGQKRTWCLHAQTQSERALINHFVGRDDQRRWKADANGFRRLCVDQ